MKQKLEILVSKTFLKRYGKAIFNLQHLTEGAVHDFVRLYRSNPKTVATKYDKLEGLKTRILEIDVAGGPRLLAHFSQNTLSLLDLCDHDAVEDYSDGQYFRDAQSLETASDRFWPGTGSPLFPTHPGRYEPKYELELSQDWIFFLDDQQDKFFGKVLKRIDQFNSSGTFLLGGPGTGKTCILLNLLNLLVGSEYQCRIAISRYLTDYLERSTTCKISPFKTPISALAEENFEILLLDDPNDSTIEKILILQNEGKIEHFVAAFDPLQLNKSITDGTIALWKKQYGVQTYWLNDCYRQKENVGQATKQILDTIAKSSPFKAEEKKAHYRESREAVTSLSNGINFLNPGGYTEFYPAEETTEDIRKEVRRILRRRDLMWKHAPGLLVLVDDCNLSDAATQELLPLENLGYVKQMNLADANKIKGLEYQHAFIFIDSDKYQDLIEGFEGTGQTQYEHRRLLRIPFSRAKDSLVVFAI